ncbi:MAG: hypothetical protein VYC14_08710 [Actinomycetota bacterium]|nr:hypothetical protein [Actinomycetota bacterium]
MTSLNLEKSVRKLVQQITQPLPENYFKERYVEIFCEELLKSAKKHYTPEQQEKFIQVSSFLEEVGPDNYSKYQAELQGSILRRLIEEGFDK